MIWRERVDARIRTGKIQDESRASCSTNKKDIAGKKKKNSKVWYYVTYTLNKWPS